MFEKNTNEWDDVSVSQLVNRVRDGCEEAQEELFGQLHRYLAFIANDHLDDNLQAKIGASIRCSRLSCRLSVW